MSNMKNLKQISMDCPNVNWKLFECFTNKREYEELLGLIHIRNCNLYVLNNAFKIGTNTTGWNLHKLMKASFQILHDSPSLIQMFSHFIIVQFSNSIIFRFNVFQANF